MQPYLSVGAIALAGLLASAPVMAQTQPPPPSRGIMPRQQNLMPGPSLGDAPGADLPGADPLQVLANSFQVQRDLGLTKHQIDNLQLASRNFLTQMQELMGQRLPPEQMRAAMDDQIGKTRPMIARELTPAQMGRFQQIMLQIQGPCASTRDPQASAQLGFSGQQRAQVAEACRERNMQMRASFQPPGPGEDPCRGAARNRERLIHIRSETDERVFALFSPEQRAEFARMQGRHLELEPPMPPGCLPPGQAG